MKARDIAKTFALKLLSEIGEANFREVARLNALPDRLPGVCHSHDYCDANEVMAECFGGDFDPSDAEQVRVWGEEWTHARRFEIPFLVVRLDSAAGKEGA